MRRFLPLLSLLGLVLSLAGCHEDPYLTVNPSNLSFPEEGGAQTIQVSANYAWTASVSGSGFKISPASGEGVGTVTVTASAASSSDETTGSVSVMKKPPLDTPARRDLKIAAECGDPPVLIISDGHFIPKAMEHLKLSRSSVEALLGGLGMTCDDVLIMTADSSGSCFIADNQGTPPKIVSFGGKYDKS